MVNRSDEQPDEATTRADAALHELARRIRMFRERKGMKQEEFAQACGISVSFASLLERGERSPSYETLVQIADALGVTLAELFRDVVPAVGDEPVYQRLADFGRTRRLSRGQVERLLAVAAAMFDPRDEPGVPRREGLCSEHECQRIVLAKGLCTVHYHRARRAGREQEEPG